MPRYVYDDGSTLTTDDATGAVLQSTMAPPGALLTDYAANFSPGAMTPGATNFMDVLKYGFGRIVDYQVASLTPQNASPRLAPEANGRPLAQVNVPSQIDTRMLIIGAALVGLFVVFSGSGNKG